MPQPMISIGLFRSEICLIKRAAAENGHLYTSQHCQCEVQREASAEQPSRPSMNHSLIVCNFRAKHCHMFDRCRLGEEVLCSVF
jgi:hypothetical protein